MSIGYGVFSGGLDSMLAAVVLREQGIEVRLITFVTPFFSADKAIQSGHVIGVIPRVVDITEAHLEMMKHPKHGFGRFMNPCIDCHALMFRTAGDIMKAEGGDFIFSGEVLNQRPKSQTRRPLDIVAKMSGYAEYLLRPLSARLLTPTPMEENGLVDRSRLLGLAGRSRKPQIELARQYGLTDYPEPAGGCLLTDPGYSKRLKELYDRHPDPNPTDMRLLRIGRHFRLPGGAKLIVGRNQSDNEQLERLVRAEDLVLNAVEAPGPLVVIPQAASDGILPSSIRDDLVLAAEITLSYSDVSDDRIWPVSIDGSGVSERIEAHGRSKDSFKYLMI